MPASDSTIRLLLLGATGAVGNHVLLAALEEPRIRVVIAPTRRALNAHPKLVNPVTDFAQLPEVAWQVDALICAIGSTIKAAGSRTAFAHVDRDLPVQIATRERAAGATRCALVSSLGASPKGNFYLSTKAQTESALGELGFPVYCIVRPSLIDTKRAQRRVGESVGLLLASLVEPIIPLRYRPVSAERIASALLNSVLRDTPRQEVIESEQLWA